MIHYAWEPWLDHEWLSADRDGRIGCFMSCCPEVLPDDILIPWPYLHNVLGSWVAYRRGCRFVELNWSDRTYDEQVAMLADSGLFVWDAERKTAGAKAVFRLIAKPGRPIGLPFLSAEFCRRDGSRVRVTFHMEDVIGGPACLPSGYLHDYESEMHVENWQFNVTTSPPITPCPRLSRLLAVFGLRFARNNQIVNRFVI